MQRGRRRCLIRGNANSWPSLKLTFANNGRGAVEGFILRCALRPAGISYFGRNLSEAPRTLSIWRLAPDRIYEHAIANGRIRLRRYTTGPSSVFTKLEYPTKSGSYSDEIVHRSADHASRIAWALEHFPYRSPGSPFLPYGHVNVRMYI